MSDPVARLNTAPVGHIALLLTSFLLLPLGCAVDDPTDLEGGGDDLTDPAGRLVLQPSELCSDNPGTAIATFADADLEAAIRAALEVDAQQDLTCSLISELMALDARFAGIESLVGIQNLTSLTGFLLSEPSIIDISPLSGLTSLTFLVLGDAISDISPLSGLTSLMVLFLNRNTISDVSPLSGLTSLTELHLGFNLITDISALSGLTGLTTLYLQGNLALTDIGALSGLTSLTYLDLRDSSITDISALSGLTSLLGLLAANNSISDISALSGLTSLGTLRLGGNSITDISELSGLTSLRTLLLDNNSITVISALSGLRRLRDVGLSNNSGLSNIQPLLDNIGLGVGDTVDLTNTNVGCTDLIALRDKEVTVLPDCLRPSELCIDHSAAAIAGFEDANLEAVVRASLELVLDAQEDLTCGLLSGLETVDDRVIAHGPIESLVGLQNLTSLKVLLLIGNSITDLSPLSGLTSLVQVQLNVNSISDMSALSELTNLTILTLASNSITNLDALSELTNLTHLDLSNNSIIDISVLSGLTNLTALLFNANSITDISVLSGLTPAPKTSIGLGTNPDLTDIQPLLDNTGLGAGDDVELRGTMVSCEDVALLADKGVTVTSDPCP